MIQLTLPQVPEYEPWLQSCAFLLGVANSGCRTWNAYDLRTHEGFRERFYALKKEILLAHAHQQGFDIQHLVKRCWNCGGTGTVQYDDDLERCCRCDGTGIYQERWVLLGRYSLAGHVFHCPAGYIPDPGTKPTIEGLIEHQASPHAWEAFRCLADGRYSLKERCSNQAAQDLITRIQFEERDERLPQNTVVV
jgi:hypothetical protein